MGDKVQIRQWWAWLTEDPDRGAVMVEAEDEAEAQAFAAALLREDVSRVTVAALLREYVSRVTVADCTPDTLETGPARLVEAAQHKAELLARDPVGNEDMLREIRRITDAAGHDGVPFLDDAVRNVVIERDRARTFATTMERLGFSLREDDQRPEGAPRFTASIPGAGRGDGHTPDEAIDKLRARLTENAGPVHVVQARAAEAQRIADAMNGGLIDIWTDLGKPDVGPESFIEALVAACRRAIAALRASCDAANHLGFFVCQDFGRPGFTAYILNVGRGNGTTMDEAVTALRARLIEDAAKAGTMIAAHKEYTRTVEYLDWATTQAERQRDEAQAWAEAFAAELTRRCARDPDEVVRAEALREGLIAQQQSEVDPLLDAINAMPTVLVEVDVVDPDPELAAARRAALRAAHEAPARVIEDGAEDDRPENDPKIVHRVY